MRLYFEVALRSFRRHLAYRAATLAGIFTNSVFGAVIAGVYAAFYRNVEGGGEVGGFDRHEILTFVWVVQALLSVVASFGIWEIALTIRSGDVVSDLMKPIDYYLYWLSQDLGRAASQILLRLGPTFLVGAILFDLAIPEDPGRWLAFALSVVLATMVSFGIRFLFNLGIFWLTDFQGMRTFSLAIVGFFSGQLMPLAFFPDWLRVLAEVLPFRAMMMSPIEALLGHGEAWQILGRQALWFGVLTLAGYALLGRAVRRVVVQGG